MRIRLWNSVFEMAMLLLLAAVMGKGRCAAIGGKRTDDLLGL